MAGDLLGISVTGLRASQSALSTTGHNISNAGVEGYSRQRVEVATNPSTLQGSGYIGNGATVEGIERIVNSFVTNQLRVDTTLYNDLNLYHDYVAQLDNLLSDENTGLSGAMETFFSAVQNGSDDPTSIPARQLIISESENLADRFNTVHARFGAIENSVNKALTSAVSEVNALVANIADINRKVADAYGIGNGATPNDLLDQRDEALLQLSNLISIQTFEQTTGEVNVLVGNGQNLVVGDKARTIGLETSADDASKKDLIFTSGGSTQILTNLVSGGEIGGLLRFRDTAMTDTYNEFGRIAIALADSFNNTHQQGITLNNDFGGDFFRDVNDPIVAANRVVGSSNNAGPSDRVMYLNIADSSQLNATDYNMVIEGGGLYRIERLSDGAEVAVGLMTGSFPLTIEFDGLELELAQGSFQGGDEFLLQPVKSGGRDFSASIFDPRAIAFGSPLVTDASLGNEGTGKISSGEVLSLTSHSGDAIPLLATPGKLDPPLIIRFSTPTTYDVLDNSDPGNPIQLDPPIRNQRYVPGISNAVFPSDEGETMVTANGQMLGIASGETAVVGTGAALTNGYPSEAVLISIPSEQPGGDPTVKTVYTPLNASAREIAGLLSNVPGVSANARTYVELSNLQVSHQEPLQIALNGVELLEYDFDPVLATNVLSGAVPDAQSDPQGFNDYVANSINTKSVFQNNGIYAVSGQDDVTGEPELRIYAVNGDDIQIDLTAAANESIDMSDGVNDNVALTGAGAGVTSSVRAGGRFDVALADGITLRTFPPQSMLFGDSTASDFAKDRFLGIQVNLTGVPKGGDDFTIDFNKDGASDNRNALLLAGFQKVQILANGKASLSEGYGSLVERIGIETSSARINSQASERVLDQTTQMRNSISSVNLDEEAANLIRFEQMYSANAQVISVARNLFDTLINSF